MPSVELPVNPLARGFYSVSEAARLIENGSRSRIYGWLRGYPGSDLGPLLDRDFEPIDGREELSFIDFVEVRFVEHFREHGVKARPLRIAAERLRERFETDHPFATNSVYLVADKADVFLATMREAASEASDRVLESLTTKNLVMYEMISKYLVPGLQFDEHTRLVKRLPPRPIAFPKILIDPMIAYGQPTVPSGVPTSVLYDAWVAEGEDVDEAAYWHDVTAQEVRMAVEFENEIYGRLPAQAS